MRLHLSALENRSTFKWHPIIPNGMFSYYYMKSAGEPTVFEPMAEAHDDGMNVLIDSGAHTFFNQENVGTVGTKPSQQTGRASGDRDKDAYLDRYIRWLQVNWDHFDYAVELDIGEIEPAERIDGWFERMREAGVARKIIRVWHPSYNTWEDWERWVNENESRYVGIEGVRGSEPTIPYLRFLKYAYDRGVRVHGFGITSSYLKDFPFYSTDSTSYQTGYRYGQLCWFDEQRGTVRTAAYTRENCIKAGVPLTDAHARDLFDEEEHPEVKKRQRDVRGRQGVRAYKRFEDFLTRLWESRGIDWEQQIETHG